MGLGVNTLLFRVNSFDYHACKEFKEDMMKMMFTCHARHTPQCCCGTNHCIYTGCDAPLQRFVTFLKYGRVQVRAVTLIIKYKIRSYFKENNHEIQDESKAKKNKIKYERTKIFVNKSFQLLFLLMTLS